MQNSAKKQHWENIYRAKDTTTGVSWYQSYPQTSVDLILSTGIDKDGSLIDIGSGDSRLVDALLELGYKNLSALDISAEALEKARTRLKNKAASIIWIESDILKFNTSKHFNVWHDRATFHFLTKKKDIIRYIEVANKLIKPNGYLIISTFSTNGPEKCSGLDITQYSKNSIKEIFTPGFNHIRSFQETHATPFDTKQSFLWSVLKKNT